MAIHGRIIRRLRITAGNRDAAARCQTKMEDAFNTASIPGIPPNGIVFVRHFDLGRVSESFSSNTLSLLIENRFRRLSAEAVRVDDREAPGASVVWFSDDLQPYISLARLIAAGQKPVAWYWRCAIPDWQPAMAAGPALVALAVGSMRTATGAVAAAGLFDCLLKDKRLDLPLRHFTPRFAVDLLAAAGVRPELLPAYREGPDAASSPAPAIDAAWQQTILKWMNVWGVTDARSLLLVYLALLQRNPAISEHPAIGKRIRQAAKKLDNRSRRHQRMEPDPSAPIGGSAPAAAADHPDDHQAEWVPPPAVDDRKDIDAPWPETPEPERVMRDARRGEDNAAAVAAPEVMATEDPTGSRWEAGATAEPAGDSAPRANSDPGIGSQVPSTGLRSRYAGLIFIVPLLNALGVRDILRRHPALVDINFPARVIRSAAERFNLPDDDPARIFIPECGEPEHHRLDEFVAPAVWEGIVFPPQVRHRKCRCSPVAGDFRKRLLADFTQKVLLAFGTSLQLKRLPPWLKRCAHIYTSNTQPPPDYQSLAETVLSVAELYLRRFAGVGLKFVVMRDGLIAATRTHLDVLFDLHDADPCIRAIGLDIDPGWVAWFGRIIQFHYLEIED